MQRKILDRLTSLFGLSIAVVLIAAASLLTWGHNFVSHEVKTELSSQQVYFPAKGSPATAGPEFAAMRQYAGQQLTTGAQAKVYADDFIAIHLKEIGGGQTYAQLSTKAQADPTDTKLAGTVAAMFKGETLRGLLLNAYAFGTVATIAGIAAIVAFASGALFMVLAALGFWHSRRVPATATAFAPQIEQIPVKAS